MIARTTDTIVAPITGQDPAPVGGIRLSGPDSWDIAAGLMPSATGLEPLRAVYGRFVTGDDGFLLPFDERCYTGESSAELFIHGSRASREAIIEAAIALGARMARPGEFTERAFLNGKLDLTQAEAVRDTIEAATELQLRQANLLRSGGLRKVVEGLTQRVEKLLGAIEASVDFSEEIGDFDVATGLHSVASLRRDIESLHGTAKAGRILRQGLRIAIVGQPNAGKSSLLNALLGSDRAIVTHVPGTTRDTIEESIEVHGLRCVFVDTAGLRETDDLVETEGIRRAQVEAASADLVWYLVDGTEGWTDVDSILVGDLRAPIVVAFTKLDLGAEPPIVPDGLEARQLSSLTGEGIPALLETIRDYLPDVERPLIRDRHEALLQRVSDSLDFVEEVFQDELPIDLASVHLREARANLGEITGTEPSTDLLESIFRDFCIGK